MRARREEEEGLAAASMIPVLERRFVVTWLIRRDTVLKSRVKISFLIQVKTLIVNYESRWSWGYIWAWFNVKTAKFKLCVCVFHPLAVDLRDKLAHFHLDDGVLQVDLQQLGVQRRPLAGLGAVRGENPQHPHVAAHHHLVWKVTTTEEDRRHESGRTPLKKETRTFWIDTEAGGADRRCRAKWQV